MKKVLITGANGHLGSFLCEFYLKMGYEVIGTVRRSSVNTTERISHLLDDEKLTIVELDITDPYCTSFLLRNHKPDYLINTAAQSHVATSFNEPVSTFNIDCIGVINILEAIRNESPETRMVQLSTSEMFGDNKGDFVGIDPDGKYIYRQNEKTQFSPRSPYGVAKVAAHNMCKLYRDSYDIKVSCAICFNYESERRGELFVTRKITKWLAKLNKFLVDNKVTLKYLIDNNKDNIRDKQVMEWNGAKIPLLQLGNLEARRDWGYVTDVVRAIDLMLLAENPDDYVIATGETHTVYSFLSASYEYLKVGEKDLLDNLYVVNPDFYRPAEVEYLLGDSSKIREKLGWFNKVGFKELVMRMMNNDVRKA